MPWPPGTQEGDSPQRRREHGEEEHRRNGGRHQNADRNSTDRCPYESTEQADSGGPGSVRAGASCHIALTDGTEPVPPFFCVLLSSIVQLLSHENGGRVDDHGDPP